jgi:HJR/Mrr/RecB family endonuclease
LLILCLAIIVPTLIVGLGRALVYAFGPIGGLIGGLIAVVVLAGIVLFRWLDKRLTANRARRVEEQQRQRVESLLRRDAVADEINYMSGAEFERFMAKVFRQQGYEVEETPLSGDQGVDLILPDLDGKRVVVQLKRWTGPVGNKAVQATFAGMAHYGADEGWIITTSTFTKSARALAKSTRVRLIDGRELGEWLKGFAKK